MKRGLAMHLLKDGVQLLIQAQQALADGELEKVNQMLDEADNILAAIRTSGITQGETNVVRALQEGDRITP